MYSGRLLFIKSSIGWVKTIAWLLVFIITLHGKAQQWAIYDGSNLPQYSTPAFAINNDNPGPNFVEEIIDDPDVPGNKLFKYIQNESGSYTTTYRIDLPVSFNKGAFVARVKGIDGLTADRVMEIDVRSSNTGFRNKLTIRHDDTLAIMWPNNAKARVENITDWHIYRFVMEGATFTAYVDENPVPLLSVTSNMTSSDSYFKWADGSGNFTFAGLVDWLIWDTSGAYAPGEGSPIPANPVSDKATIFFLTNKDAKIYNNEGYFADSLFIAVLK